MDQPAKQECALCLVRDEDRILLVRQDYGLHLWTFPGGVVEPGEGYAQAAVRELCEETGLQGKTTGLVCLRTRANQTIAVFSVQITGGVLLERVRGEIEAAGWFDEQMLDDPNVELFSAAVARKALTQGLSALPYVPWTGGSGDADMYF